MILKMILEFILKIKSIFIIKKNATKATLLLDYSEWNDITTDTVADSEPYILVYYVTKTEELQKKANAYAKEKGCKLVILPCNMDIDVLLGKYDKPFTSELNLTASPTEFLTLFKNASYIFTNSFHGTVFSLLNHKQFCSRIQLSAKKRNDRVLNLLNQVGLISGDFNEDEFITDECVSWNQVDEKIRSMRKEGWEYLLSITDQEGINCNES